MVGCACGGARPATRQQEAAFRGNLVVLTGLVPGYLLAMLYIELVFLVVYMVRNAVEWLWWTLLGKSERGAGREAGVVGSESKR